MKDGLRCQRRVGGGRGARLGEQAAGGVVAQVVGQHEAGVESDVPRVDARVRRKVVRRRRRRRVAQPAPREVVARAVARVRVRRGVGGVDAELGERRVVREREQAALAAAELERELGEAVALVLLPRRVGQAARQVLEAAGVNRRAVRKLAHRRARAPGGERQQRVRQQRLAARRQRRLRAIVPEHLGEERGERGRRRAVKRGAKPH